MGCGASSADFDSIYKTHPRVKEYQKSFERIGLGEKDVGALYNLFSKSVVDKTLRVKTIDLMFHLHEDSEHFMRKIIMAFSKDKDQLNFQEFVFAVWSFCTLRTKQKSYDQFVFELYDTSKSGAISSLKAQTILEEIYLTSLKKHPVAARAHKALEKVDGDVTLEEFHKLSDTYAGMLTAVHPIQEKLRRRVLGIKTWEQLEHVRVSLSGGRQYAPMDQVLVLGPDAVVFPPDNNMSMQQDNSLEPSQPLAKKITLRGWTSSGDAKIDPGPVLSEVGRVSSRRGSGPKVGLGQDAPTLVEVGRGGSRRGSTGSTSSGGSGPAVGEIGRLASRRGSARGGVLAEAGKQNSMTGGAGGGLTRKMSSKQGHLG